MKQRKDLHGVEELNELRRYREREGAMDIDRQIERIYKNPYESDGQVKSCCVLCGSKIWSGEDCYVIDGKAMCERCVDESREIG